MWVLVEPGLRFGDADAVEQRHGALAGGALAHAPEPDGGFGHLPADRVHRVERGHRFLEDHRDPRPLHRVGEPAFGHVEQVVVTHLQSGRRDLGAARHEPHQGQRGHRLARPALADDAQRLTRLQPERDIVHRVQPPRGHRQAHTQVLHLEQGHQPLSPGDVMSRTPSPIRFAPITKTNRKIPGNTTSQGR